MAWLATSRPSSRTSCPTGRGRQHELTLSMSRLRAPALPIATAAVPVPAAVSRLADYRPRRVVLENGMRLVFERRPSSGVVALELYADAGILREAKPGLAALTGRLLEEGTTSRDADGNRADHRGRRGIARGRGDRRLGAGPRRGPALSLDLLADLVDAPVVPGPGDRPLEASNGGRAAGRPRRPRLPRRTGLPRAGVRRAPDGQGSSGRRPRPRPELTRQDVVDHHRRHFVPEGAILAVAGDFDPRRLVRLVERAFGDWPRHASARPPLPPVPRPGRPRVRRIHHPSDQVHILLGHLGIARNDPDFDALLVLDHIFGSGPGFSDRLGRIVRDEMGLVYAIGGGMTDSADILPGVFRVYAGTMPDEADRVVATIVDQVRAMRSGAFSDEEVERARRYLAGAWVFDFQGVEQAPSGCWTWSAGAARSTSRTPGPTGSRRSRRRRSARRRRRTSRPSPSAGWSWARSAAGASARGPNARESGSVAGKLATSPHP